jgi:DNA repair protein RadA/Sms
MTRRRTVHRCTDCGAVSPRWAGRCPTCGEWNTLAEEVVEDRAAASAAAAGPGDEAVALADVDEAVGAPRPTGIGELDRVLGGGLVPGSVTLLGGEPGIGKSTLLLQALTALAADGARCLLVCAEESPQQVKRRAARLGALAPGLWLVSETGIPGIRAAVEDVVPDVLVVDSIQTVWDPEVESAPGSVTQVRGCAHAFVQLAKTTGLTTVLVGHVTKDGALAGPRVLEHVVDTVLTFEGERHHALRLLRALKHRFGPAGELGLFEMTDDGLIGVPDPSGLFLGDRQVGAAGSAVFAAMEGQRPLLVELQALVSRSTLPMPRRSASGLDAGRLALLVAVLERRAGLSLVGVDVYVSAVGGVRVAEPGADLALCLALASAATDQPLPADLVAFGEVGLAGEIRQVSRTPQRLTEAARLGFRRALVPMSAPPPDAAIVVKRVATLADAIAVALGRDGGHGRGTVIDIDSARSGPAGQSPPTPPVALLPPRVPGRGPPGPARQPQVPVG